MHSNSISIIFLVYLVISGKYCNSVILSHLFSNPLLHERVEHNLENNVNKHELSLPEHFLHVHQHSLQHKRDANFCSDAGPHCEIFNSVWQKQSLLNMYFNKVYLKTKKIGDPKKIQTCRNNFYIKRSHRKVKEILLCEDILLIM